MNEQKNRTDKWLKALGLQLPSAITKYGSVDSLRNFSESVNPQNKGTMKSERSTAEDQTYMEAINRGDMETAQKMVDEKAKDT